MVDKVILIGTSHTFQTRTPKTTTTVHDAFAALVRHAATQHQVCLIAEETSHEANMQEGVESTICDEVSQLLFGTNACYVDPHNAERAVLGIEDVSSIRMAMLAEAIRKAPRGASPVEIMAEADRLAVADPRVRMSDEKREREWIRRLRVQDKFPALLVCGANHVLPFRAQAAADGLTVEIAVEDWQPAAY